MATARGAAGSSPPSPPSAAVTAIPTSAGPPTIASVTATNGSVQLQVTPPTYTSGLPIIAYEYSSDDGRTWHRPSTDPAATTITVTGLTNGTAYRMRVRAVRPSRSWRRVRTDDRDTEGHPGAPRSLPPWHAAEAV